MSTTPTDGDRPHGVGKIERIALAMRLAARRIGERNTLDDEAMHPRGLRRHNQVTRPFSADTGVGGGGGTDFGFVEFVGKICELMDDDRGPRGAHRSGQC